MPVFLILAVDAGAGAGWGLLALLLSPLLGALLGLRWSRLPEACVAGVCVGHTLLAVGWTHLPQTFADPSHWPAASAVLLLASAAPGFIFSRAGSPGARRGKAGSPGPCC